jgi:tellurite resistance protein TerC
LSDLLRQPLAGAPGLLWVGFACLLLQALFCEVYLTRLYRGIPSLKRSALSFFFMLLLTLGFCLNITYLMGKTAGLQFFTGYLIEEALSVDNLFVFLLIFRFFSIAPPQQQRVLFWGIFGAMALRAAFIAAGVALIHRAHWVFYIFGTMLVYTGIKMVRPHGSDASPDQSLVVRLFRRWVPSTPQLHGNAFFVRQPNGRRVATPLLLVLVVVEVSDIVFAVDSIPAIFSVTTEPFLVYTSNICALLGLRSLYFLIAATLERLKTLHYGLAAVLVFIGIKMLLHDCLPIGTGTSLAVICACLGGSLLAGRTAAPPAN